MRLLLVEDNVPLADELTAALQRQGYAVDWLADGRDAVYQGQSEPYDLIILDLGLPGLPGLEVLAQWRAGGLATPVLILTARGSWAERIEGLKGKINPVVVTLRGSLKEVDMGDWKAGDKAEIKHNVSLTYYKLEVDGRTVYEIDALGMKRVIEGVDQLAAQRTALGL
ncbi:MAG: phage major tail tube protein [Pseudomonas sp.]|nr:phage major tail tube protein [Pseudomonas sp.]